MATLALRGSGTPATTGTTWASVTNAVDGAAGSNPATYATMTNAVSAAVATIEITGYNFAASILTTDVLNSVSVSLRHFENNTGRFNTVRFQAFDGATAIGTQVNCTLATSARNDVATVPVTLAQLRSANFKIVVTITGAANTQSRIESIDYVDVTADYTRPPTITQASYRFYDQGTESGSVALAAQDTPRNGDITNGDGIGQLRVRLQSTNTGVIAATDDWQLQYEKNASGTWVNVPSAVVAGYDDTNLTEGQATTNRLGAGSGTFVAGKVSEDGLVDNLAISANNFTELLFSLTIVKTTLVQGDTLRFRVLYNGATTGMTYTVTPQINVVRGAFDTPGTIATNWSGGAAGPMPTRHFAGGTDEIKLAAGALATMDMGPSSHFAVIRTSVNSAAGGLAKVIASLTNSASSTSSGLYWYDIDGSAGGGFANCLELDTHGGGANTNGLFTVAVADGWVIVGWRKANGSAAIRWDKCVLSTGTWTRGDGAAAADITPVGAGGFLYLGRDPGGEVMQGDIAAYAVWDKVLTDAEVNTLKDNYDNWVSLAPVAFPILNQSSTATPVDDYVGTSDQISVTGTSVVAASSPLGFAAGLGWTTTATGVVSAPPVDRPGTIATNWGTWAATATADGWTAIFTEPFTSSAALTRFLPARFRTQWATDAPGIPTGSGGQDDTGSYGPDLPGDIRVSAGKLVIESGMQNYGESSMLSEGLWDMSGTVEFDLTHDANSEAQAVISFTDRPHVFTSYDGDNANGPKPANGFSVYCSVPICRIWNNYVQIDWYQNANASTQDPGSAGPPSGIVVDGTEQHWKIEVIGGRVFVSINGTQATPEFNLPTALAGGGKKAWVRLCQHNHASEKYTTVDTVTSLWDNLVYPQAELAHFASVALSGPKQFGWHLETQGGTTPITHNTSSLAVGTHAVAWLIFNIGSFDGSDWDASSRVQYKLNGNTTHEVPVQIAQHSTHAVLSMSIPVLVSELVTGVNTIVITGTGFIHANEARYANVQLALGGTSLTVDRVGTITTNWGSWTAAADGVDSRLAVIATNWGTWTATATASVDRPATIATNWGTWTANAIGSIQTPAGDVSGIIATNWGTWAATATALTDHVATIATNWGTWTTTANGLGDHPATITTNWGTWITTASAGLDRTATIATNWGTWTTTATAVVSRTATIATNWGTWAAAATALTDHAATIATNWGGWTANALGNISSAGNQSGVIATNWGRWAATATASADHAAMITTNWATWAASGAAAIDRHAVIASEWGPWVALGDLSIKRDATIVTGWGTWNANADGVLGHTLPATITTNWGRWTAAANGRLTGIGIILNDADALYLGSTPVDAVYAGAVRVWSNA